MSAFETWAYNSGYSTERDEFGDYVDEETRDALAAYNFGLEAAAKVCEEDDASAWLDKYGRDTGFDAAHVGALERVAVTIRALKEE